jgi:outer membrane protein
MSVLLISLAMAALTSTSLPTAAQAQSAKPPEQDETRTLVKVYSLVDLYRHSLKLSEQVQISREELYVAQQTKKKAMAVLRPRVDAFGEYTHYSEKKTYSGSLIQPNSAGGWGLRASQSFTINGREITALRISEDTIEKNNFDLESTQEGFLFDVTSVFYEVLNAKRGRDIAAANVTRLKTYRDAVATRLEIEEVAKTDLFRAEAELSSAKADVVRAENFLKFTKARLASVANLSEPFEIEEPDFEMDRHKEYHIGAIKEEALKNRAEIKASAKEQEISERRIKYEKGAYWPVLSVEGLYRDATRDPDYPYDDTDSLSLGLRLDLPLYDGGLRKANISESRARQRQADLQAALIAKQVLVETEQAYLEIITQQNILQSLEDQFKYAQENIDAVGQQFDHGLATSLDAMDANTLLVTSERELSEAQYRLQLALLRLERAKGTFLKTIHEKYINSDEEVN